MPAHAETLLADVVGASMNPGAGGSELPNKCSRRRVDFNEYGFSRIQWGCNQAGPSVSLRAEYSLDNGATWAALTEEVPANAVADNNAYGTWDALPADLLAAPYNVLVRAMLSGSGGGIRVTYVTLQMR